MTMHLLMKAVEEGRTSYDSLVPVTIESWAQSQPPRSSLMFLEPGQTVTLREIMLGLCVPSGNDAAVAAALHIAPSVAAFAQMMTAEARSMGLNVTRFAESAGITELNITTAAEYAVFIRQYVKLHPRSLADFHSVLSFTFPLAANMPASRRGNFVTYTQYNSNSLLRTFPGVDGLKTGYIMESGYNIALTAQRDSTRFVLVILGASSSAQRIQDGETLLSWAFDNFKTVRPDVKRIEEICLSAARLWKGKADTADLKLVQSVDFTSPLKRADLLKYEIIIPENLIAPLPSGYKAGYLVISDDEGELFRSELVTAASYERGNFFKRLWHSITLFFRKKAP
jgi:D-alanyl-D-alanine carboxypeptidase (penicillin-binding protein 5/6)